MSTSFVNSSTTTPVALSLKMTRSKSGLADMSRVNSPKSSIERNVLPKHSKLSSFFDIIYYLLCVLTTLAFTKAGITKFCPKIIMPPFLF